MHELRIEFDPDYFECDCADAKGAETKTVLVADTKNIPAGGSTVVRSIGGVTFVSNIQK